MWRGARRVLSGEARGTPEIPEPEASNVGLSGHHHTPSRPHPVYTGAGSTASLWIEEDNYKITSQRIRTYLGA